MEDRNVFGVAEPFGFEVDRPREVRWKGASYRGENWTLTLPHQCDNWYIACSPDRQHVIAEAKRFRAELDAAIAKLETMA